MTLRIPKKELSNILTWSLIVSGVLGILSGFLSIPLARLLDYLGITPAGAGENFMNTLLTLEIVSFLALGVGLERLSLIQRLSENEQRVEQIESKIESIDSKTDHQLSLLNSLERPIATLTDRTDLIFHQSLEGLLRASVKRKTKSRNGALFKATAENMAKDLLSLAEHGRIRVRGWNDFINLYEKIFYHFQSHDEAHFIATSLPSKNYFWDDRGLQIMKDFIGGNRKVSRIFVMAPEDHKSSEACEVIRGQKAADVKVYYFSWHALKADLRSKFYMYEESLSIGWEVNYMKSSSEKEKNASYDVIFYTKPGDVKSIRDKVRGVTWIPYEESTDE